MKKSLWLLSALFTAFAFSSCSFVFSGDPFSSIETENSSTQTSISVENPKNESIEDGSSEADTSIQESVEEESSITESVKDDTSEENSSEENTSEEEPVTSEKNEDTVTYKFTEFNADDKALFMQYVGEVIPFAPNNGYEVESYYDEIYYVDAVNFYTYGNTQAEFDAYRALFDDYTFIETYLDEDGDTWYWYEKGNIVVDMSYYYYEGQYWIDVYVCLADYDSGNEDVGGGEDIGGGNEGGEQNDNLITNEGAGLPTGTNGVYTVDFTKASPVNKITDLAYYLDGCPSTGSPAVLVIPVEFSNLTARSKGYSIDKIRAAFNGGTGATDYYSVHDYYYTSSYGKLDLNITVLDEWFKPQNTSTYYQNQTIDYYGTDVFGGDQMIMDEALQWLSATKGMDLSQFDSDQNGTIDSIVMISTLNVSSSSNFTWAYRYWNLYTDDEDYYYEYNGVSANDYIWASYQFLHEDIDEHGNTYYTNTSRTNTYTYIHEFGHILGADDYYDTAYVDPPMDGHDIMDGMIGDHNPYTKFLYGWLKNSRLVVAEDTVTLTLEDFTQNGDTIIIANNWDEKLGVYQEFYVLMYYTNTGLNGGDYGYFDQNGIVVYHVNSSLYVETENGQNYYYIHNTNTDVSDEENGTEDNLIEFVLSTDGNYVYLVGDTISAGTTDDNGNKIAYTFTVNSLTSTTATITFKKNR